MQQARAANSSSPLYYLERRQFCSKRCCATTRGCKTVNDSPEDARLARCGAREITLYTRPGCHLCEEAKELIEPMLSEFSATLREVNIDDDARSEERRVGKECRSRCDWSSDVCSSDLRKDAARPLEDAKP